MSLHVLKAQPQRGRRGLMPAPKGYVCQKGKRPRWNPYTKELKEKFTSFVIKREDGSYPDDEREAMAIAQKWNAQIEAGMAAPDARGMDRSFERLVAIYRDDPEYLGLSANTKTEYDAALEILLRHFKNFDVPSLKRQDLKKHFYEYQQATTVKQGHRLFAMMRRLLNFAIDELEPAWLDVNPCAGFKEKIIARPQGRIVEFSRDEIVSMIRAAEWMDLPCLADTIYFGICAAQSICDVLALPLLDNPLPSEDFPDRFFHQLPPRSKTGEIPFMPETALIRRRMNEIARRNERLFPGRVFAHQIISTRTGKPYTYGTWTRFMVALRLLVGGKFDAYNARKETQCKTPRKAHRKADRRAPMRPYKEGDNLPFKIVPSILSKKMLDMRDTGLSFYTKGVGGSAVIASLVGGHAFSKNTNLENNYVGRAGEPTVRAIHVFDPLEEMLYPTKLKLVRTG